MSSLPWLNTRLVMQNGLMHTCEGIIAKATSPLAATCSDECCEGSEGLAYLEVEWAGPLVTG